MFTYRGVDEEILEDRDQEIITDVWPKLRTFLQESPLYVPVDINLPEPIHSLSTNGLPPPAIALPCEECSDQETTNWKREEDTTTLEHPAYRCVSCGNRLVKYLLITEATKAANFSVGTPPRQIRGISAFQIMKAGQFPPWGPPKSKRLRKVLAQEGLELYQKGVACLREGRGIGAAAYFRRLIENRVDEILRVVDETARLDGDEEAVAKVKSARERREAADKVSIAAEAVPARLRPGNMNPLKTFYGILSGPLHTEPEADASKTAEMVLRAITYVFENWEASLEEDKAYRDDMLKAAAHHAKGKERGNT
jgi:hypothetical protein